ncbi:hypothetical protein AHMF7605_10710 [Adhaeribacter arboris]|uniref:Secretion system C-terminal sorting domain-containing protein n=1 Tax=Adhaeribacter arboris TaxID=2072846 RepID=A0A2T2YEL1_9BACT|nr:T9SS type A sorting domain-containing protein [Adhaeribacter arboris]PSR53955.1 hypothetical protein AHMF7605_10710 [Adhaeribacter arboris]
MKILLSNFCSFLPTRLPIKWKKHFSLIQLLIIAFPLVTTAQNLQWDRTLGGNSNDNLSVVQPTSDGGYILGGTSASTSSGDKSQASKGNEDYWLVKLKADGTKEWDKTFGGNNSDRLTGLQQTKDGGYILAGNSQSDKSGDKTEVVTGSWIVKVQVDGSKAWDKTIVGGSVASLRQTRDGGYILGGGYEDYWVVKLSTNGTKAWEKTFGGDDLDILTSVQQTKDGGYILGGSSRSGISGDKSEKNNGGAFTSDYWMVKLRADGTKDWDKTIGADRNDGLTALQPTSDGGYILGGRSSSSKSGDKSENLIGGYDEDGADYWVVKVDARGNKVWDSTIGSTIADILTSLQQTQDGGYILGGYSLSGKGHDKTEDNKGGSDYWIVKLKADGSKVWDKTIGANNWAELAAVQQTSDGGYIIGGSSNGDKFGDKTEANKGVPDESGWPTNDYWIVKLTEKKPQTITFTPISDKKLSDAPFKLSAKASSGLPVSFSVVAGPAKMNGNRITLTGVGEVIVKAFQIGNATYLPAEATQTFQVKETSLVTKLWDKTLGGTGYDRLQTMITTPEGGYLLGGSSESGKGADKSEANRGTDYWVVKLDSNGKKLWDKTLGGSGGDGLVKILATSDGGYLLGGSSTSDSSRFKRAPNKGESDYWLVKIDGKGNKLWDKSYGGNKTDVLQALVATPDGGYLLAGSSNSNKSGDKSEENQDIEDWLYPPFDYWVVKVDAKGTKLWDKAYSGDSRDILTAMTAAPEGGYLLGGYSYSNKGADKSENNKGNADFWVIKIDETGKRIWDKTYGSQDDDALTALEITQDGGFLLGGTNNTEDQDMLVIKIDALGNQVWKKNYDYSGDMEGLNTLLATPDGGFLLGGWATESWIVKIDETGSKLWERLFTGATEIKSILVTPDKNYLIGGDSYDIITEDKTEPGRGGYDYWVIKIKEESAPDTSAWDWRFGTLSTDNLTSVIKTSDGGYLAGGYTAWGMDADKTQTSRGMNDYWIIKTDKNGKKLWDKRYGSYNNDYLKRVIQTQDGGYLLGGSTFSGKGGDISEDKRGDRDFWIIKVDAQGNKQWDKRYGGKGEDELEKIAQLSTGEYVLGGYSSSPAGGDKSQGSQGKYDYWMVKINTTGAKIWDKRYGGSLRETLSSFTETNDGGLLVVGTSLSPVSGDKTKANYGETDFWVVRTDKAGNKLWDKTYGGSGKDNAYSVGRSNGDTFFIAGTSWSAADGDKSQTSHVNDLGIPTADYWILKIDGLGKKLWEKTYGGSGQDQLQASTPTQDGGFVLAGTSNSLADGDKSEPSYLSADGCCATNDFWIVKLDGNGNKQMDKRLGGNDEDELRTVLQTEDGGLLLGGRTSSERSGDVTQPSKSIYGGRDYWLIKVAPESLKAAATQPNQVVNLVPLSAVINTPVQVTAYPNPFSDKVTVKFSLPETQTATVKIYDHQGNEVSTLFQGEAKANQTYKVAWQAGNKPAGLYFLKLQTPTLQQQSKLLLTK